MRDLDLMERPMTASNDPRHATRVACSVCSAQVCLQPLQVLARAAKATSRERLDARVARALLGQD